MPVKSLSICEWGNTMVIEAMAHWWKPLHLQYYELGVFGVILGKNHYSLVCKAAYWFFRSVTNKQRKDRWLQTMKLLKQRQIQRKRNKFIIRMKANSQKSYHWRCLAKVESIKRRKGTERRYRCGFLYLGLVSLGQELQIACLLVIKFENSEPDCFVPWGPKTQVQ